MKIPFKNSILSWMMKKRMHQIDLFLKYPFLVQNKLLLSLLEKAKNMENHGSKIVKNGIFH